MDKRVKVWDATEGWELVTLEGHTEMLVAVRFSPDGKWLVSTDSTVCRVWNGSPRMSETIRAE